MVRSRPRCRRSCRAAPCGTILRISEITRTRHRLDAETPPSQNEFCNTLTRATRGASVEKIRKSTAFLRASPPNIVSFPQNRWVNAVRSDPAECMPVGKSSVRDTVCLEKTNKKHQTQRQKNRPSETVPPTLNPIDSHRRREYFCTHGEMAEWPIAQHC
jgi:hypothetical protein